MSVNKQTIQLQTEGNADVVDITIQVETAVKNTALQDGIATIFCPSATSALTTIEYESGCVSDLRRLFDEIADAKRRYAHNARWHDGN